MRQVQLTHCITVSGQSASNRNVEPHQGHRFNYIYTQQSACSLDTKFTAIALKFNSRTLISRNCSNFTRCFQIWFDPPSTICWNCTVPRNTRLVEPTYKSATRVRCCHLWVHVRAFVHSLHTVGHEKDADFVLNGFQIWCELRPWFMRPSLGSRIKCCTSSVC